MTTVRLVAVILTAVFASVACSSVTSTRRIVVDEQLPRPEHIWVYDFAASARDVPINSRFADAPPASGQTPEQLERGRKAGRILATHLAAKLHEMGLPARHAPAGTVPRLNDLVIRGYLVSYTSGNEAERFSIGMGSGAAELRAVAEGFQVTAHGLRLLGEGTVDAGGSKSPGLAMSAAGVAATGNPAGLIISTAVKLHGEETGSSKLEGRAKAAAEEIAKQAKPRFEAQGWIR